MRGISRIYNLSTTLQKCLITDFYLEYVYRRALLEEIQLSIDRLLRTEQKQQKKASQFGNHSK